MILYFLGVFTSSTILLILYIYILSRQNVSKKENVNVNIKMYKNGKITMYKNGNINQA